MAIKRRVPPSERLSASLFKELADSAARLNSGSDEFSKAIGPIDVVLKKLNLGVSAWFRFGGSEAPDHDGNFAYRRIGYAKVNGKWGLALSSVAGNIEDPIDDDVEAWLFNDAPRSMRLEALDYIPDLLEQLVREANMLADDLRKKAEQAHALADTISTLAANIEIRR